MQVIVKYEDIFRALADRNRIRILRLLIHTGEKICVCEFTDSLEVPQYNLSKNLKILSGSGLIKQKKEGRWVYYSLNNENNSEFLNSIYSTVKLTEGPEFNKDLGEFNKRMEIRENGKCLTGIKKEGLA